MTDDAYTNQNFMLDVGDGRQLHVVDWGNPKAETPFIFLHGGPGGSVKDRHKQPFDPTKHRVIFFDQRGSGESTPYGDLKHNTTQDLIFDITKITDHLKIKTFNLYGYSWGSTLALCYAIKNPAKVQNLIIGGVYSGVNDSPDHFIHLRTFFPDIYTQIIREISEQLPDAPKDLSSLASYLQTTALEGTPEQQKRACFALEAAEFAIASYDSDLRTPEPYEDFDPVPARIEAHYIKNNCFLPEEDYILNHAAEITVPVYIVQGRSDLVCPPKFAYQLSQKLPHARLYWANSNHWSERELNSIFRTICSLL